MTDHYVIFITVPTAELGETIANALVEERLAACVNRVPGLISTYRWQGKVEREAEELLLVKTRKTLLAEVMARVKELHTYQVPEIIALPITEGSADYLEWIFEETNAVSQK